MRKMGRWNRRDERGGGEAMIIAKPTDYVIH
jgi:hypothetical protein